MMRDDYMYSAELQHLEFMQTAGLELNMLLLS